MVRKSKRVTRRRQRGGNYGYTGPAFSSAGGVPLESRTPFSHCGDVRGAGPDIGGFMTTQFGGKRRRQRSRKQRGGGCGCMIAAPQRGGGGGSGGFHTLLTNDLGKVHGGFVHGVCPPAPREAQIGGAAADEIGLVSYKSGYGFGPASVVSTNSAHYLNPQGYDRTVMAGGSRRRRSARRKGRKGSRKH